MNRIECPFCGERDVSEFHYEGDANRSLPRVNAEADPVGVDGGDGVGNASEWFDYVYLRDNPKGWHVELWRHASGCRRYVVVERHTVTHEVRSTRLAEDRLAGDRLVGEGES